MHRDDEGYFHYRGSLDIYEGNHLPHWDVDDGVYFVTFRLADSMPSEVIHRLSERYHRRVEQFVEASDPEADELARHAFELYLEHVDTRLDENSGSCHMFDDRVARLVRDSIRHFDGERYDLYVWVVMPNHVHVAFRRHPDWPLGKVVGGWKSYTAHEARSLVDFGEHFWQRGYFSRLIRSESEFEDVCNYIWSNPEKAGLEDWPWKGIERRG